MTDKEFEDMSREVLGLHLNETFTKRLVEGAQTNYPYPHDLTLDLVNADASIIGDAKYFTMRSGRRTPRGKLDNATNYAEALVCTRARVRFLVFGNDIEVARIWTWMRRNTRFPQVDVYFLSDDRILTQILLDSTARVIGQF
jgi:hypothetical protein